MFLSENIIKDKIIYKVLMFFMSPSTPNKPEKTEDAAREMRNRSRKVQQSCGL